MKGLQAWWSNLNPVTLTEVIRQCLYVALAFQFLNWTDSQLAIVLSAFSACLSLFTRSSTVSNQRIEQKVDEKVAHREMAGTTGTGDGMGTWPKPAA